MIIHFIQNIKISKQRRELFISSLYISFKNIYYFYLIFIRVLPAFMSVCQRATDLLELDLQTIVNCQMVAENLSRIFCMSSQCS